MYRKDFIEAEIQKLAQVLARILGLKNDGKINEAEQLAYHTLDSEFGLSQEFLEKENIGEFENWIEEKHFSADKLNLLAQLLFETVYPFTETNETMQVLHKTALILNKLEEQFHQQSFENLHRREMIDKFFSNRQYE